jgi:predicted MFS family arabinose efflux permease
LLGTVAAEIAAPTLMIRFRHRTLLAVGFLLLGVPVLALLPGGTLASIVTVSAVRGFGFGLSTVLTSTLTAELLPADRRGEGFGLYGVAAMAPEVVALPAGVWLADRYGIAPVVVLTAASALIPMAVCRWLPAGPRRGPKARELAGTGRPDGLLAGLRRGGQLQPFLIFGASTIAAGVITTFLPLATGVASDIVVAGLLVQALVATITRWWAGRIGDRRGHARLLVPALVIAAAGMITMIALSSPVAVIAGMCLFGAGFGVSQNATFTLMIDRMPPAGAGTASALWNLAYDGGYGAGPAVFGLFVGHSGYALGFALTGVLMLAGVPAAKREFSAARSSGCAGQRDLDSAECVLGVCGAAVPAAKPAHEDRQIIERPAQPVESQGALVDRPPRGAGVAAGFLAADVADDPPEVALRRREAHGVPVDQEGLGTCPEKIARVRLTVGDDGLEGCHALG